MRNTLLVAMFSLASTTALAGAGHGSDGSRAADHTAIDRTLSFEAGDMWFTPGKLAIAPGETVKFEITNSGTLEHEFVIGDNDEQAAHREMMRDMASGGGHDMSADHHGGGHDDAGNMPAVTIPPGETATLVWTAPHDVEEVEFACNIPGHYEAGMSGDIQIEG
ncbi:cupredoxin domain-containing protein [Halomonas organivorans]|uniref:Putative cupredoxin-like copper-binding protein n=1 Tax=Halomonas organivorans TaxID=257772 RepID=A0A7W5BX44_9GAMM|nr:plastocyanin/azurin family copper-binding protein [Halomonas organivorans]MBB3140303.1 putative cupredoxin-like copper-binding protein [Halomonas organivorans]